MEMVLRLSPVLPEFVSDPWILVRTFKTSREISLTLKNSTLQFTRIWVVAGHILNINLKNISKKLEVCYNNIL